MNWTEEIFSLIRETVAQGVQEHLSVVATITGVILICAVLRNFDTGGMGEGIGKSAFLVEYGCVALLIGQNVLYAKEIAEGAMDKMVTALNGVSPVLLTASLATRSLAATTGMGTSFLVATEIVSNGFRALFLPVACLLAALSLVDNLSTEFSISQLVDFLKKAISWGLGLVMTVYLGILSVQSCLTVAEGTAAQKTAKFAVGAWPVVGQYLAESFDAVSASATVIHATSGTGAMITILTMCMAPALELLLLAGLLKLISALTQPVAEPRICNCISSASMAISLMAGLVTVCAVMLTITIGMFLSVVSNVTGG